MRRCSPLTVLSFLLTFGSLTANATSATSAYYPSYYPSYYRTSSSYQRPSTRPDAKALRSCVNAAFLAGGDQQQRIVAKTDAVYTDARLGEKIQDDEFPALIAYATSDKEVPALIRCAQKTGFKAVPRAGGHHFEAYSSLNNTLVIDIAHINHVKVSSDRSTARVGAGIRLGALYTALNAYNKTFVGGICPTVGLGGLLAAGGFNMQMRALGMSVDYVKAAKIALADGRVVTADKDNYTDLFWAIRGGGGGTYGVVVEYTLQLITFPRSALVMLSWSDAEDRFPVAKKFLEWAPRTDSKFTSQVNVYKHNVTVLGWYYGGSDVELKSILDESGLLKIGKPKVELSGNCNTDNARLFGYILNQCVPDDKVPSFVMNVIQDPFAPVGNNPQFKYKETPKNPGAPLAPAWDRFRRITKSFFVTKNRPLTDTTLKGVVDRIAELDEESEIWGEWHAWNISSPASASSSAFPWRKDAYAHLEFQIHGSEDKQKQKVYDDWMNNLEHYLRPAVGAASYAGYMDKFISTNPFSSYYGNNVCKLVNVKRNYDPSNFFTNPSAISPATPAGVKCPGYY